MHGNRVLTQEPVSCTLEPLLGCIFASWLSEYKLILCTRTLLLKSSLIKDQKYKEQKTTFHVSTMVSELVRDFDGLVKAVSLGFCGAELKCYAKNHLNLSTLQ